MLPTEIALKYHDLCARALYTLSFGTEIIRLACIMDGYGSAYEMSE